MSVGTLYVIIFGGLLLGAITVGILLKLTFKKTKSIDLIQTRLANSDASIAQATHYLKITNEWSDDGAE